MADNEETLFYWWQFATVREEDNNEHKMCDLEDRCETYRAYNNINLDLEYHWPWASPDSTYIFLRCGHKVCLYPCNGLAGVCCAVCGFVDGEAVRKIEMCHQIMREVKQHYNPDPIMTR